MKIVGYADKLSVAPGDEITFMVSCELPSFEAQIVRLGHGDATPCEARFRQEPVVTPLAGTYPGRVQRVDAGSLVRVADGSPLRLLGDFTIALWIYPTTPRKLGGQGLVAKWSSEEEAGYALTLGDEGDLSLWLGDGSGSVERPATGVALRPGEWAFVACAFTAARGTVLLSQEPLRKIPSDPENPVFERQASLRELRSAAAPLTFAATSLAEDGPSGLYNGKLEAPMIFSRALRREELDALRHGNRPEEGLVGAWDLGAEPQSSLIVDRGPHALHGVAVQAPTRAVTSHTWTGRELCFRHAPDEYAAAHFHDDDVEDARWEPDFELLVPDLRSGLYAARLRSGEDEYHIPFVVRPRAGGATASIAFLIPTYTYLAYANEHQFWHAEHLWVPKERLAAPSPVEVYVHEHPELGRSLYDLHSDGSGVCYASRLRPMLNLQPGYHSWLTAGPRHVAGDLCLIDWLEQKGFAYDVLADDDLHDGGVAAIAPYSTVITGSHPEYFTEQMLDAVEEYVHSGGRLMYLGGNGFYWVTSVDPDRPHVIEVRRGAAGTRSWDNAPGEGYHSTTGEPGGLWRHRGRSPNRLVGVGFSAEGWDTGAGYRRCDDSFSDEAAWIFEGVGQDEQVGDFGLALGAAAADEVDRADALLGTPPQTLLLASATELNDYYQLVIEDLLAVVPGQGGSESDKVRADMVYLDWPDGGAVFSVGSISWSASLAHNRYENNVSRITENVLRRFLST